MCIKLKKFVILRYGLIIKLKQMPSFILKRNKYFGRIQEKNTSPLTAILKEHTTKE